MTTALVSAGRMDEVVDHLRKAVAEGRQAYWVCPLVEEKRKLRCDGRRGAVQDAARGARRRGGGAGPRAASAGSKDGRDGGLRAGRHRVLVATKR